MKKLENQQLEMVSGGGQSYDPQRKASPEFCYYLGKVASYMGVSSFFLGLTGVGGIAALALAGGTGGLGLFLAVHC